MNQNKKMQRRVSMFLMFALVFAFLNFAPMPKMAGAVNAITDAKALITDSDLSAVATTTFTFTNATSTAIGGYIDIIMPTEFGDVLQANITCPANHNATAPNTETIRCTAAALSANGAKTIVLEDTTNPAAAGDYMMQINHYDIAGNLYERAQVMVFIIDDVWMTARVNATLDFTIAGVNAGTAVNGENCTATTTATTTPFGTLNPGSMHTVCQTLTVTTNATDGFTVTVEQDEEMTSDGGDNINSFNNSPDGTGSTTAAAWVAPTGILDADHTYGHMGVTSDDEDLSTLGGYVNQAFDQDLHGGTAWYAGLNSADPLSVFHHDGPADGLTQNKGTAHIAYSAQINALQQAGDYENILTYIVTPQY